MSQNCCPKPAGDTSSSSSRRSASIEAERGVSCPTAAPPVACGCPQDAPQSSPCCPTAPGDLDCCPSSSQITAERPGYRLEPFVTGWLTTPVGEVPQIATGLTRRDDLGAWQMRWGIGRDRFKIAPGLYAVGQPDTNSPVLVSANYKLSFDALRRELGKLNAWILVINTRGINVWCAAGKGTFGTEEIVRRVRASQLELLVGHRRLILPQLGAPGVAAHQVARQTGFRIIYGPVRASDLPAFLQAGMQATPAMRRVSFTTRERLILTPVELVMMLKVSLWIILGLFLLGGIGTSIYSLADMWQRGLNATGVYLAGLLAGAVLTPILLPWIPGPALAWKGALTGLATALAAGSLLAWGLEPANTVALLLALPAVASWCAMNFTGSTTYTSPSGVEKEMRRAIPLQALTVLAAGVAWFWGHFHAGL